MSKIDGLVLVTRGQRWRVFAPGWRAWRWLGFLWRRFAVRRSGWPPWRWLAWVPAPRCPITIGMPRRRFIVRVEPIDGRARVGRAK